MTSSANSPFKLGKVTVKPGTYSIDSSASAWKDGGFVRYIMSDVQKTHEYTQATANVLVAGVVELAKVSWLNEFGPGSATRIGTIVGEISVSFDAVERDPHPYSKALWFACEQLNPMLDTFTTLFGIENNIDIHVEHRLRPVDRLLQNLIMPRPMTMKFNMKGRYAI